jgi:hypothetical protein
LWVRRLGLLDWHVVVTFERESSDDQASSTVDWQYKNLALNFDLLPEKWRDPFDTPWRVVLHELGHARINMWKQMAVDLATDENHIKLIEQLEEQWVSEFERWPCFEELE